MNHLPLSNTAHQSVHTPDHTNLPDQKTALLLIEYQHEWLATEGKLNSLIQDREQFRSAIAASEQLVIHARQHNVPIIHSGLRFSPGHPELGTAHYGLRAGIPKLGTFVGKGADFIEPFTPQAGELIVSGRTGASAFSGSNLDALLRHHDIDTLLIAGFALHVCIESTLRHAHDLGYNAIVITDASAAFTSEQHLHVTNNIIPHFGYGITAQAVISKWDENQI